LRLFTDAAVDFGTPRRRWVKMAGMTGITTVAVMFTDLVDSTRLSARLGAARSQELFDEHFDLVASALSAFGGEEVKRLGDGVMAVFDAVSTAVDCAVALQQAVHGAGRVRPDAASVRIGVSVGEVRAEGGDYFGVPVIEAARLCADGIGGQVLCSAVTAQLAGAHCGHPFRALGARVLKGLGDPIEVAEVVWTPIAQRGLQADFRRVDDAPDPNRAVRAIDEIHESPFIVEVQRRVIERLGVEPGERLLDVGSGTGDDCIELSSLVGHSGSVVGVDLSEVLVREATRRARAAAVGNVEFRIGDAYELPFEADTFDGCCSQRTFQYLTEPLTAIREMARVTRPGGRLVVADTDWETQVYASDDEELTARVIRAWCDTRPNGRIAHQLYGLFRRAGLNDVSVSAYVQVVTELTDFRREVLRSLAAQAVSYEAISEAEASRWIGGLELAAAEDRFLQSFAVFVTAGIA
jgi:ubiquinone/menaquinone biosynthesis C-methylase UbiE/class 3 adenylate cyclase